VDPLDGAITDERALRAMYETPLERVWKKDIGVLDEMCRRLIAASPMVFIGTVDGRGHADVSPRGGPPGFVAVLDEQHLAIPDATGNRRLDTLSNIVATGRAGTLFVIPGRDMTLRVAGVAAVTARRDVLGALAPVGKAPRTAIVIRAEEVYTHCAKAFIRAALWDPSSWPDPATLPTPAQVAHAHRGDPTVSVEEIAEEQRLSILHHLA
jgi:PPOX class probable FMN-dependent enzyme